MSKRSTGLEVIDKAGISLSEITKKTMLKKYTTIRYMEVSLVVIITDLTQLMILLIETKSLRFREKVEEKT